MIAKDNVFRSRLAEQVLIFDGAMGTSLHALDLSLSDYQGLENCVEILNLSRPDAIERVHRGFLEIGCDVVETNTFGGMKHVLAEFGLADRCHEINVAAARIARRAADALSTPKQPRFVAGSMGPGTKLITLRQIDYDGMLDSYLTQARGLLEGGVDLLIVETCQDILQTKTALFAAIRAMEQIGRRVPLMASVTMETTGTMLVGTDMAAALTVIESFPEVETIGLNCATGPQEMSEHIRLLARTSTRPISVMPNAGLPQVVNGQAHFPLTPGELARWLREFVEADGVRIVGGCCGTTPEHLRAVVGALRGNDFEVRTRNAAANARPAQLANGVQPSSVFSVQRSESAAHDSSISSLYQSVPLRQDNSFLIVGERCNTNGSKKFKQLLADGDIDGCVAMAVEQVKEEGAHVIDVCVDYVGRAGAPDMHKVIDRFAREVNAPLMLDSTQLDVLETGLKLAGGKCIVNSVNLEDGEERLARIARLCRQYGAAVVALTIDEDPVEAMGKTAERKLTIASRMHRLLVEKHGLNEEDIFWDCLTFPITTGNEADRRLGLETLDGIQRVMQRFPRCQSILGVSNISFGLQPAARVVLNSAFLHEARERGLTAAIVHAGKILPQNQISAQRWEAALDLIHDRRSNGDPLERFIGLFTADEKLAGRARMADLPLEERLKRRIIDGARAGIEADLDEALGKYSPIEIINTLLLDGMRVVGELFGSGQMQLPFVLKSAETMKSAVAHLEPHMEKKAGGGRGKIVLATVRGDVHDIGKNLVDIILSNNGYTVYNLGIKQPIAQVIAAWREHQADAIGLSGLLVKSTIVMRDDLVTLAEQGISVPVILGGAALTRRYVESDLRPLYPAPLFYAGDAFDGLHLMGAIVEGRAAEEVRKTQAAAAAVPDATAPATAQRERNLQKLTNELEQRYGLREVEDEAAGARAAPNVPPNPAALATVPVPLDYGSVPTPPFWGARVLESIPLRAVLAFINEIMLFQVQWGYRKKGRSREDFKRFIDAEVRPHYRELVERCEREHILQPQAVYGFWPCRSEGQNLIIYNPPATPGRLPAVHEQLTERLRFTFPRQSQSPYRCLADFWRPNSDARGQSGVYDVVALQIVTAGQRVSEVARKWFAANDYQQYLFLHGLGVETAEALAEYVHKQIRVELGIVGADARDLGKLFQQGYQGSRYSFGYPACPNLEDQRQLMELLQPERIGISLSEEFQLEPEQSTSAIVAHHPAARYFNVR